MSKRRLAYGRIRGMETLRIQLNPRLAPEACFGLLTARLLMPPRPLSLRKSTIERKPKRDRRFAATCPVP